ncbi:MAG: SufS family cysteine desulfurase, partial [Alphaproteobacteria bacterium]|nr:SufS family cysteine desulfurase [Alphaproteobacteria bacterium]
NAASAQKPRAVIDAISRVYETEYANVHRGVHYLSQKATDAMEAARERLRGFINAARVQEVIFVRGATEGINLVASSWGRANLKEGDEVILSEMEHHSNIIPWQIVAGQTGAKLRVAPIDETGTLRMDEYEKLFSPRTKIVAMAHVSNALGTVVPIAEVIRIAHGHGVPVLVDGCQAAPHMAVDVQALDADFYVFSGHKIYGPGGIGVLYGKEALLDAMPPYQGGGEMIDTVTFAESTWADLPFKFEAGTPNIADSIALGAAVDYVASLGVERVHAYEDELLAYATEKVGALNNIRLIGTAKEKVGILSFVMDNVHPHDIGTILDREGVAVRTGHHCAQPVMEHFDVAATVRISIGLYNTRGEIDSAVAALGRVQEIFGR